MSNDIQFVNFSVLRNPYINKYFMSYSYLFKFILIGDTGKPGILNSRCREVLPTSAVYRQALSSEA